MDRVLIGRNPVREALKAGRPLNKILLFAGMPPGPAGEIKNLARRRGIPVQRVERDVLDRTAEGANHQGVVAFSAMKEYVHVEDLLDTGSETDPPLLVLLDEINDPRNLGAILRCADAVGASGVIIPGWRSASLTPAAAKASAGAVEYVPVARVTNLPRTIDYLKEQGLWVVGADAAAEKVYWDVDLKGPLALVIGGESKGLGRLVREKCDFLVRLPMAGRVGSLNAAVAAAVLLYEVLRQRRD